MEVGEYITCTVWPHEGRAGEIVDAVQVDAERLYNIWLFDTNEILAFEEWEIVGVREREGS